jgi:regulatory protein
VYEEVHDSALGLLSQREYSRHELARKLRRKGHSRDAISAVLDRLEAAGLVSDERYARLYVRDRLAVNPQGRHRIVRGLRAKGIAPELASAAVEEVYAREEVSDRASAEALARKRLRALADLDPLARRRRLSGYLARRGFDSGTVGEVLSEVLRPREV